MKAKRFKIVWIVIITLLFGLLLVHNHFKSDFPLTVTIEMSVAKKDNVQLFYTTFRGFNELESIVQPIKSKSKWQELRFDLPDYRIKGLRIDPGFNPSEFAIKSIKIENKVHEISITAQQISDYFDFVNIEMQTSLGGDSLVLISSNNDPQLIFTNDLRQEIIQRDGNSYYRRVLIIGVIYLILMVIIILFGSGFIQVIQKTDHYLQNLRYEKLNTDYVLGFLRKHGFLFASAFFISVFAFGYELFNFSLSYDDELASLSSAMEMKNSIITGRWAFYFLNLFFHPYSVMPYYTTALALIFIASAACLFIIYQQGNLPAKLVFLIIFISSPVHSYYLAFNLSFYYAFGMLLATISYLIFVNTINMKSVNIGRHILAGTLLAISIALYQSMLTYFIVFLAYFFFLIITQGTSGKKQISKFLISSVSVLIFGVIIYKAGDYLTRYFFLEAAYRNNIDYLKAFDGWGQYDVSTTLNHLVLSTLRYLVGLIGRKELLGIAEKSTLIVALILAYQVCKNSQSIFRMFVKWFAIALLVLSPFTLIYLNGLSLPIRAMMPLSLMIGMLWFATYQKVGRFFRRVIITIVILIFINNVYINTRLFYASKTTWEADKAMAHQIVERIYHLNPKVEDDVIRIAFVGDYQHTGDPLFFKAELFGVSFFNKDSGLHGRKFSLLKTLGYNEFIEANPKNNEYCPDKINSMPTWPQHGSVALCGDIVVVKLSE